MAITQYHDDVSAGAGVSRSREIRIGQIRVGLSVNGHFNETTDYVSVAATYVFATPVLGGQASIGLSGSYGRDSDTLSANVTGTLTSGGVTTPFALSSTINQSLWGFGDLSPLFTLRWNEGANNFMTYVTGNVPVGAYDRARLSNLGTGHGAIDVGGAYTYYNQQTGHEISGTLVSPIILRILPPNIRVASTCTSTGALRNS